MNFRNGIRHNPVSPNILNRAFQCAKQGFADESQFRNLRTEHSALLNFADECLDEAADYVKVQEQLSVIEESNEGLQNKAKNIVLNYLTHSEADDVAY